MSPNPLQHSPFSLDNHDGYRRWRDKKLASSPKGLGELLVEYQQPADAAAAPE